MSDRGYTRQEAVHTDQLLKTEPVGGNVRRTGFPG